MVLRTLLEHCLGLGIGIGVGIDALGFGAEVIGLHHLGAALLRFEPPPPLQDARRVEHLVGEGWGESVRWGQRCRDVGYGGAYASGAPV